MNNYDIILQAYDNGMLTTAGLVALLEADEVFKKYVTKTVINDRLKQIEKDVF